MNSDSTYQSNNKEVIDLNKIFIQDSFTDLINILAKIIGDFYLKSLPSVTNFQKLILEFESNLSKLSSISANTQSELIALTNELNKIKENLKVNIKDIDTEIKIFKEKAQKIFKEMKKQKINKVEDIYNDYAKKHSLKNDQLKINADPLRKSHTLTGLNNNSNKNIIKERNKTINKNNTQDNINRNKSGFNFHLVKNLVTKLGEFNTIIKNYSNEEWENFNKIHKQVIIEINRSFNNMKTLKNSEGKNQSKTNIKNEKEEKNPFIMVNNNNNNVTMTTTNNNSYYNIIDKDKIQEIKSANNSSEMENEINTLKNKNISLEKKLKELEEEMTKTKEENESNNKLLNDKNTSLSKDLVNKNREIQLLQNSNKLKISEITKLKLIVKNNEKQLKVQKRKVDELKEKSPGNIKIKDLLGNKKGALDNKNKEEMEKLENEIKTLKETIDKKNENINELEKEMNLVNDKNKIFVEELNFKEIKIKDDDKYINNLKSDKDKLINKLKEHKNIEDSYKLQLDSLKIQIKEMMRQQKEDSEPNNKSYDIKKELKKHNNDLICENLNLKSQLEYELNYNKELREEIKSKDIQIDGFKLFINKLMKEKENLSLNKELNNELLNKMESNKRVNTDSGHKFEREEKSGDINKNENYKYKSDNKYKRYHLYENKDEEEQNKSAGEKKDFINKKDK